MPYLRALSSFRDEVRRIAREQRPHKEILALCDALRDNDMVDLGVMLDDQDGEWAPACSSWKSEDFLLTICHPGFADGRALVKLVPPEILLRAREEKAATAREKAARKAANEAARIERLQKGRKPPTELFVGQEDYSKWDEDGIPTHDKEGKELAKKRRKMLQKEFETQKKLHEEWKKWQSEQQAAAAE
jgi:cysteinyl-tRNA synthetase